MADNVTANSGSGGAVFATDEIGGTVHWPFTKLAWGPRDTANEVDAASGKGVPMQGEAAHDAVSTGNPVLTGARASAAAPTDVSADGDVTRLWALRNGALAINVTAAGALIPGDATNGLDVDVTRVIPGTSATHLGKAEDAVHASGDTGVMALAVRQDTPSNLSSASGDYEPLQVANGRLWVSSVDSGPAAQDAAISGNPVPAGYRASTAVPTDMSADGDIVYPWALRNGATVASLVPHTTGGLTPSKLISAASTNATSLKASAGKVYSIFAHNTNAAVRFLKLYNKASAPTVGTDVPVLTLPIPGNTAGAGFVFNSDIGIEFATGIAYALTTGSADNDTAAVAAGEIVVNFAYK